jgi:phosphoribosylformimino-5-aminoimidazole carboxamide ribotide isomerase
VSDLAACRAWLARNPGCLVVGSEAIRDPELMPTLAHVPEERLALSLDFSGDRFLGPPELLARPGLWPSRLIVMTLGRVGSDAGPDIERLDAISGRAGPRRIFAAGGVRGGEDLLELARRGTAGVLVATALHDRRIGRAEITAVAGVPAT